MIMYTYVTFVYTTVSHFTIYCYLSVLCSTVLYYAMLYLNRLKHTVPTIMVYHGLYYIIFHSSKQYNTNVFDKTHRQ